MDKDLENKTPTALGLPLEETGRASVFHRTNGLRWVVDSINERYLQQEWVSETGETYWEDVETVCLSPDVKNTSANSVSNP